MKITGLTYEQACSLPDPKQIIIDGYGNVTVETEPPAEPVPQTVTPRQARIILARYGLLDAVNAQVAQLDQESHLTWEYASEVQRDNPLVASIGAAAGMSTEQIDKMFREAAAL